MRTLFILLSLMVATTAANAKNYILNNEDAGGKPISLNTHNADLSATWFSSTFTTREAQYGNIGCHYVRIDLPNNFFTNNKNQFPGGWGFGVEREQIDENHISKISLYGIPTELLAKEGDAKPTYSKSDLNYIGDIEWTYSNDNELRYTAPIENMDYTSLCFFIETNDNHFNDWNYNNVHIYGTKENQEEIGWDGTVSTSLDNVKITRLTELEGLRITFTGANSIAIREQCDFLTLSDKAGAALGYWSPAMGSNYAIEGNTIVISGLLPDTELPAEGKELIIRDYGTLLIDGEERYIPVIKLQ